MIIKSPHATFTSLHYNELCTKYIFVCCLSLHNDHLKSHKIPVYTFSKIKGQRTVFNDPI